ncbi:MAG: single-stranded-DNA-specific exonuclease RecJ [Polyangia bacterium]
MSPAPPWSVAEVDPAAVERLRRAHRLGPVTAGCLLNRGLSEPGEVSAFLRPRLADLALPDGMADLEPAAGRTARAVTARERIGVFGDYDVDGVTSAALVVDLLRRLGASVGCELADRFGGGYGLTEAAVERFAEGGCNLLIVLDCGTSDRPALLRAAELELDTIVIDHHRPAAEPPPATAFVNPRREDCRFVDREMAAVGLAFYFAAAVRRRLADSGVASAAGLDPRELLDLVALGTVADLVPLRGNNRILTARGLERLGSGTRPGLRALVDRTRIGSGPVRTDHVAFQLAPRLNAAGRLGSPGEALELLLASDSREAARLADRLEHLSNRRRELERGVAARARRETADRGRDSDPLIVVWGDGWHRGVIGIVAARLAEELDRPAFVVGFDESGVGTGSARGRGRLDVHRALSAAADQLERFGGHREAAGFTVGRERIEDLRRKLLEHAGPLVEGERASTTVCDSTVGAAELNAELLAELGRLAPFGKSNPEPLLDIAGLHVLRGRVVGTDHLKLELRTPSGPISAFGPRLGRCAADLPRVVRVAAALGADEWKGGGALELRLAEAPIPS